MHESKIFSRTQVSVYVCINLNTAVESTEAV